MSRESARKALITAIQEHPPGSRKSKIHGNVKCDCGHRQKDHYQGTGFCHHSTHPQAGQCGCTWFHPNVNYIRRKINK